MFMELDDVGRVLELLVLAFAAVELDFAEVFEGFVELAGEALAVEAEGGEESMRVDNVEGRGLGAGGWGLGAREEIGFEKGDTLEAPGGVGQFVNECDFSGSGGAVFLDELAAVLLVYGRIFGREDGGAAGQSVSKGIERGTLLAGFGSGAGRMLCVRAIDFAAVGRGGGWSCCS